MAISNNTLTSDVWTDVRSTLVAASITAESINASVYAAYNDKTPTRPQIVIYPVTYGEDSFKFGSSHGKKFINVVVECYYKNTAGLDEMFDSAVAAIKDASFDDIELVAVASDTAFNVGNQQKFHMKSAVFTFDRE